MRHLHRERLELEIFEGESLVSGQDAGRKREEVCGWKFSDAAGNSGCEIVEY